MSDIIVKVRRRSGGPEFDAAQLPPWNSTTHGDWEAIAAWCRGRMTSYRNAGTGELNVYIVLPVADLLAAHPGEWIIQTEMHGVWVVTSKEHFDENFCVVVEQKLYDTTAVASAEKANDTTPVAVDELERLRAEMEWLKTAHANEIARRDRQIREMADRLVEQSSAATKIYLQNAETIGSLTRALEVLVNPLATRPL